jgi:hypothetical protein
MVLGSTQPLAEMSTRILPGGKGRPERKVHNFTAICEPTVSKCGGLDVSEPYGLPGPGTGIALLFQQEQMEPILNKYSSEKPILISCVLLRIHDIKVTTRV